MTKNEIGEGAEDKQMLASVIINNENRAVEELKTEKQILDYMIEIILRQHPIVDDRYDILNPSQGCNAIPEMEITFRFGKIDGIDVTAISFLDGNARSKTSTGNIRIFGLIPIKVIYDFLKFILDDHECISSFHKDDYNKNFELSFDVNECDENMHGIGCGKIGVSFEFAMHEQAKDLYKYYASSIITEFSDKLMDTEMMKSELSEYCKNVKHQLLDSFSDDEIKDFISLFEKKDFYSAILNLDNKRFMELYKKYNENCANNQNSVMRRLSSNNHKNSDVE